MSLESFANNLHASLNRICDLLSLISHRLPDASGFIPAIVMRFIISKDGDSRKLIVLNVLECRPYLKQKFRCCLAKKRAQLDLLFIFLRVIYNIIYKKIYQLALLVRRNVVVLLPVTLTDVAE